MRHSPSFTARRRDGSKTVHYRRPRGPSIAATKRCRLLCSGQPGHCACCGYLVDCCGRLEPPSADLNPGEPASPETPALYRWHVSDNVAHAQADSTPRCRIPRSCLRPGREEHLALTPCRQQWRRRLVVRTRRLIDSGAFSPEGTATAVPRAVATAHGHPAQAVLHILPIRCHLLLRPQTVQAADHRPHLTGTQPLLPRHAAHRHPARLLAIYGRAVVHCIKQLRRRDQLCTHQVEASTAADFARTGWDRAYSLPKHHHIASSLPVSVQQRHATTCGTRTARSECRAHNDTH
jgi:hypothetical protein